MGDNDSDYEFERDEFEELSEASDAQDLEGANESSLHERAHGEGACSKHDCELGEHPYQEAWVALMSAVPVQNQVVSPAITDGVLGPDQGELERVLQAIRPDGIDEHAIDWIREQWSLNVLPKIENVPEEMMTKLENLSKEWEGGDFDKLQEVVESTKKNLGSITDDINDAIIMLDNKAQTIYALQGNGVQENVPFPAPQIYTKGRWIRKDQVHIRPAWTSGDCEDFSPGEAMEKMGMDGSYPDEVHQHIQARAQVLYQHYNSEANGYEPGSYSWEDAKARAENEAGAEVDDYGNDELEDYEARAEYINQDITGRRDDGTQELGNSEFNVSQREQSVSNNPEDMDLGGGDLSSPPPPGMPESGGAGGFGAPPNGGTGPALPDPNTPPEAGGGMPGGGRGPGTGTLPGDPESDWGLPNGDDEDDDWGGGLQSGGGGGGVGGGVGTGGIGGGAGGGAGAGGGIGGGAGGMVGAGAGAGGRMGGAGAGAGAGGRMGGAGAGAGGAGAGRGMGAGSGSGSGAGGRGSGGGGRMGGGMGMMPMAGAGAGGGKQDGESKNDDWLHEEDDVWGIGNEDDDPFA